MMIPEYKCELKDKQISSLKLTTNNGLEFFIVVENTMQLEI
jgi:hypothetical protein